MSIFRILSQGALILIAISSSSAQAHTAKLLGLGAQAGGFAMPYPAFIGVGPAITFLDTIRVGASVGLIEPLVARASGDHAWIYGLEVRLKIPFLVVSPTVGIG